MPFARSPRARDDRTLDYLEPPAAPPAHSSPPPGAEEPKGEELDRTAKGLGKRGVAGSREEEHWSALYEEGLLNLDAIPVLVPSSPPARMAPDDEVEAYILQQMELGTTMRVLVEIAPCPGADLMRTIGRMVNRGLIRLM
jgi:hypothetical protein